MDTDKVRMTDHHMSQPFKPVSPQTAAQINLLSLVVNDWAGKKGWNDNITIEQDETNAEIACCMLEIAEICQRIEDIRNGRDHDSEYIFEKHMDTVRDLSVDKRHTMSQLGLMCTEIAECSEAVLDDKQFDDHIPSVPAIDAEMADLTIRVAHFCGQRNIDWGHAIQSKHEYNINRPRKHGKKA